MAPTSSLLNMTTNYSDTTTEPDDLQFCPPLPNIYFETLDSSVPYIINAALNVPLAIATIFANFLVLLAMRHITSIRSPSKLLLCSLVLTDLGSGLIVQPQFTAFLFMRAVNSYKMPCFMAKSLMLTSTLFSAASLLTLTAISLDRYTALFFHLKYHEIATTRRICVFLTIIWSLSLVFASQFIWGRVILSYIFIPGIICFLVISMAYIKIYQGLRRQHDHQVQHGANAQAIQLQTGNTLNMSKYRGIAYAMMWVYVLFVICYLPYLCTALIVTVIEFTPLIYCIWEFSYTIFFLNSCLNPFVYCLRLPEVRTEVVKQLRQFCCRRNPQQ